MKYKKIKIAFLIYYLLCLLSSFYFKGYAPVIRMLFVKERHCIDYNADFKIENSFIVQADPDKTFPVTFLIKYKALEGNFAYDDKKIDPFIKGKPGNSSGLVYPNQANIPAPSQGYLVLKCETDKENSFWDMNKRKFAKDINSIKIALSSNIDLMDKSKHANSKLHGSFDVKSYLDLKELKDSIRIEPDDRSKYSKYNFPLIEDKDIQWTRIDILYDYIDEAAHKASNLKMEHYSDIELTPVAFLKSAGKIIDNKDNTQVEGILFKVQDRGDDKTSNFTNCYAKVNLEVLIKLRALEKEGPFDVKDNIIFKNYHMGFEGYFVNDGKTFDKYKKTSLIPGSIPGSGSLTYHVMWKSNKHPTYKIMLLIVPAVTADILLVPFYPFLYARVFFIYLSALGGP